MTTTTIKAADAAEFLSLVPFMLGYRPSRSLVVIPFHGSRSLAAMRFDLPDDGAEVTEPMAATVIGMVCRIRDADAVAFVAYTDASFAGERMPYRELAEALEAKVDASGLRLSDSLCVAADGWGSYLDPSYASVGRPLAELSAGPGSAELEEPVGDQAAGAALPHVDASERERVGEALDGLERAVHALCGEDSRPRSRDTRRPTPDPPARSASRGRSASPARLDPARSSTAEDLADVPPPIAETAEPASVPAESGRVDPTALAAVCRLDDLPELFERALDWDPARLDAYDAAALVWCLSRPSLRDVALVQWSGTLDEGDEALDAQLRWEAGEEYPPHLAMRMWGDGRRPRVDRLVRALELARRVAAVAPREAAPGPLAMCAWLSWALGLSTHAETYAARACEIEPEHGLSEIVLSFVRAGHLPDWAFHQGTADEGTARRGEEAAV